MKWIGRDKLLTGYRVKSDEPDSSVIGSSLEVRKQERGRPAGSITAAEEFWSADICLVLLSFCFISVGGIAQLKLYKKTLDNP